MTSSIKILGEVNKGDARCIIYLASLVTVKNEKESSLLEYRGVVDTYDLSTPAIDLARTQMETFIWWSYDN